MPLVCERFAQSAPMSVANANCLDVMDLSSRAQGPRGFISKLISLAQTPHLTVVRSTGSSR